MPGCSLCQGLIFDNYRLRQLLLSNNQGIQKPRKAFKGDDDTLVNPFELEKLMQEEDTRQQALKEPEGSIFGSLLETQPVERHSTKYGDNLWPSKDYPTYVSGGGFLMNKKAAMALQELLTTTVVSFGCFFQLLSAEYISF